MKKIIFILVMAICSFGFASDFSVKSVKGRVTFETVNGSWENVAPGKTIALSASINVGVKSELVLSDGKNEFVIGQMKKGVVSELISARPKSGKITIGNSAVSSNVAGASTGKRISIQTAATRADDANSEDDGWEE